jgi:hypothetical protein
MASSNDPAATEDPPGEGDAPGEASLLVSEFPPPPYYYRLAKTLTPPTIPHEALERGTKRAAAAAARARAESERLRLGDEADKTDAILGGVSAVEPHEEEEGDVVAVFGEIVEDPLLVEPPDRCEDPTVVRDQVKRLNRQVLQRFVNLVQDLVHRPMDNKYVVCARCCCCYCCCCRYRNQHRTNACGIILFYVTLPFDCAFMLPSVTGKHETTCPTTHFSCSRSVTSFGSTRLVNC